MCGVFGALGNFDKDKVRLMGILNQSRGNHGSGMFDGKSMIKLNEDFQKLVNSGGYEFIQGATNLLIGHTRYATCGAKSKENCHPFQIGNMIGVHNGQIRNFDKLKKKYKQKKLKVDSQILFYLLDQKGIEGLKEVVGYFTIVWQDLREPNLVYFIQHECDLSYCRTKDGLYFCSDEYDLTTALGYEYKSVETLEDTLYIIDINTLKIRQHKVKGLKADTGYNYSKNKGSYTTTQIGFGCDTDDDYKLEYDKKSWYNDKYKSSSSAFTTDKRDMPYYYRCPHCAEYLTEQEILKNVCGVCRGELSGCIYQCQDCEGKMLLEDIMKMEGEICVNCGGKVHWLNMEEQTECE